jgi:LPS export ABC transporter permease LptF
VRILTRYILREVLTHALLGGVLFTFVLFMKELGPLLELAVRNSTSSSAIVEIFFLMLPNMFTVTIPMAVLVGILLGLSRLAADSEITAMRASGVGVWRFVGIVAIVAAAAWGVGLVNTLYFAPKASAQLLKIEDELKNTQATYEIQPRVFYEDLKNVVLYVADVRAGTGAARWHQVFLADLTDPVSPEITTAEDATVASTDNQTLIMRLRNGTRHETTSDKPDEYSVSTFVQTDLPLETMAAPDPHLGHNDAPVVAMSNRELIARTHQPGGRWFLIELHRRYAYPWGFPPSAAAKARALYSQFCWSSSTTFSQIWAWRWRGKTSCPFLPACGWRISFLPFAVSSSCARCRLEARRSRQLHPSAHG